MIRLVGLKHRVHAVEHREHGPRRALEANLPLGIKRAPLHLDDGGLGVAGYRDMIVGLPGVGRIGLGAWAPPPRFWQMARQVPWRG